MSRFVNAIVIGISAFVVMAGLAWIALVGSETREAEPTEEVPISPTIDRTTESPSPTTRSPTPTPTSPRPSPSPSPTPTNNSSSPQAHSVPAAPQQFEAWVFEDVVEGASLRLIVGGLVLMFVVFAGNLVAGFIPFGGRSGAPRSERLAGLLPTPSLESTPPAGPATAPPPTADEGRGAAEAMTAKSLDDVLDRFSEQYGGEPRLLRVLDDRVVVRLYQCKECAEAPAYGRRGCGRAAGFLEVALSRFYGSTLQAFETLCKDAGAPVCEFEVRR